jgi:hypothetical protein
VLVPHASSTASMASCSRCAARIQLAGDRATYVGRGRRVTQQSTRMRASWTWGAGSNPAGGTQNIPPVQRLAKAVSADDRRARHAARQLAA